MKTFAAALLAISSSATVIIYEPKVPINGTRTSPESRYDYGGWYGINDIGHWGEYAFVY